MAYYGPASSAALNSADPQLVILFNEVVKTFDNKVLYGNRDQAFQFELYKKGRELIGGVWVITNQSKVVTYKDGYTNLSKHNYTPSKAVDVAPYPVNWKDSARIYLFAGFVLGTAQQLLNAGIMQKKIRWGGDWDRDTLVNDETFLDLVHFEIID